VEEIGRRPTDYLNAAELFFDLETLNEHYTYSFLRGIHKLIKDKKYPEATDWSKLIILLSNIAKSETETPQDSGKRQKKQAGIWMAGWRSVYSATADVLQELLRGETAAVIDMTKYRPGLVSIFSYLFNDPDPTREDEKPTDRGDLFNIAINSVRGKTFEAFTLFTTKTANNF